ncbi:MAG: transcriptional regulator [Myxococcales bacterium]|nr:transcriptional regulator [Myxococcales bacterium]
MVRGHKNPLHHGLPARLRKARRTAKLTPKAVVLRMGGDQALVREIEDGKRLPTVGTLARLAAALAVTPAWLAYGIGEPAMGHRAATCDGMGARLQGTRLQAGYSKAAVARLVGLSPSAYAKIENGGQSGVDVIESLAKTLGVSPGWLAFGVGPQQYVAPRRGRPPAQSPADAR